MGTKMATTYTTLALAYLEENLYEIIGKKYSNDIKEELSNYGRDIWMIASYSGNAHKETSMNYTTYYKIKFTMEHSLRALPFFLDILIKNVIGQIITDIYHKLRHSTIPPLQNPPPQKLYKIHSLQSSK